MFQYSVWVRISPTQTANTVVYADTDYQARMLAEAQYGVGNVLNYSRVS